MSYKRSTTFTGYKNRTVDKTEQLDLTRKATALDKQRKETVKAFGQQAAAFKVSCVNDQNIYPSVFLKDPGHAILNLVFFRYVSRYRDSYILAGTFSSFLVVLCA